MQHRIRAHFRQHSKSFRFDANNTTLRLQSCSRSGSQQSGEGEFHLQLAADRQSVGGNNKSSGDTAVPRLAFAVMNTIIFSLPGESHICRQSISVVLPLMIHRIPLAAQPHCDKLPLASVYLKTHKVRYRISPLVHFWHPCGGYPVRALP